MAQTVLILLVKNMYNENIGTFWYRKLCMKTSMSVWILLILLVLLFGTELFPQYKYYSEWKYFLVSLFILFFITPTILSFNSFLGFFLPVEVFWVIVIFGSVSFKKNHNFSISFINTIIGLKDRSSMSFNSL